MRVLVIFATIEGQTEKIAKHIAAKIGSAGHEATLLDASEMVASPDLSGIDKIILAAPVHERRHPKDFEALVMANKSEINARPTMAISVSLRVAFPDGHADANDYLVEMKMRTGLEPDAELLVAGAVRRDAYDYYSQQVLRHVVLRGQDVAPDAEDIEFTDWEVLDTKVEAFLAA